MKKQIELKEYIDSYLCLYRKDAAEMIGCSERHLRRIINGESPAGYRLRRRLAEWGKGMIDVAKLAMIKKGGIR